jgi:hypothetical protein
VGLGRSIRHPRLEKDLALPWPEKALAPPRPEKFPAPMTSRHHDPPPVGEAPSLRPRAPSPRLRRPSQPRSVAPKPLRGGRLHGRPFLINGGGSHWRGRHARLLHRGGHGQPLFSLRLERLSTRRLGVGLGRHDPRALGQALQGREAEHASVDMPTRRQNQG